jgi:hypothetical protein
LIGALAQLGERLHGMQEVSGSIPLCSTKPSFFQHKRYTLSKEVDGFNICYAHSFRLNKTLKQFQFIAK